MKAMEIHKIVIVGENTYFIPRNAEIATAWLINQTQWSDELVKQRATNLAYTIWRNFNANVTEDEGKMALANAIAEIGQWIADRAKSQ